MKAPKEIKALIEPFQLMVLRKGKCVACLTDLKEAKRDGIKAICQCGRIYIYNESDNSFRRALLTEV